MKKIQLSGSAIIKNGKLLVLWKIKHGHYEFPGGKVESGETNEETALRETKEELGCDVELIRYLEYIDFRGENKEFRSHIYLAEISKERTPKIAEPDKFRDLLWLPMKDYKNYTVAPNVKDFCGDYIKGKLELFQNFY